MKTQRNKESTIFHTSDLIQIKELFNKLKLTGRFELLQGINGKYIKFSKPITLEQKSYIKLKFKEEIKKDEPLKVFNSFSGCLITGMNLKFTYI